MHLVNFLGMPPIQTIGYWFGTSSLSGEIESPIGPLLLNVRFDTDDSARQEHQMNIEVKRQSSTRYYYSHNSNDTILSNTITAQIGKPIIICYSRNSYGERKMGALVIVPEAGAMQFETSMEPKTE